MSPSAYPQASAYGSRRVILDGLLGLEVLVVPLIISPVRRSRNGSGKSTVFLGLGVFDSFHVIFLGFWIYGLVVA